METVSMSFTPIQAFLAIAFQLWVIIAPIMIMRKLNYMTSLLEQQVHTDEESSETV